MNREQAENLLAQLIFDELDEPVRSELLAYLKTDAELNEQLGDMRAAAGLLGEAVAAEAAPKLDPLRRERLHEQVQQRAWRHRVLSIAGARPLRRAAMLAACLALGTALVSILLPSLGAARRTSRQMQVNTQLRGIHQAMVTYAQSNDGRYPESLGQLLEDGYFTPEYLISPYDNDTQIPPDFNSYTLEQKKQWADENSSFKMLNLGGTPTLDTEKVAGYAKIPGGKGASIVYDDNTTVYESAKEARRVLGRELDEAVARDKTISELSPSGVVTAPTTDPDTPPIVVASSESPDLLQDERLKIKMAREQLAIRRYTEAHEERIRRYQAQYQAEKNRADAEIKRLEGLMVQNATTRAAELPALEKRLATAKQRSEQAARNIEAVRMASDHPAPSPGMLALKPHSETHRDPLASQSQRGETASGHATEAYDYSTRLTDADGDAVGDDYWLSGEEKENPELGRVTTFSGAFVPREYVGKTELDTAVTLNGSGTAISGGSMQFGAGISSQAATSGPAPDANAGWDETLNSQAIVLNDRNTDSGTATRLWTESSSSGWHGTITRNDNSTSFEAGEQLADTRYGGGGGGGTHFYAQLQREDRGGSSSRVDERRDDLFNGPAVADKPSSSGTGTSPGFADAPSFDLKEAVNSKEGNEAESQEDLFKKARGLYAEREAAEGAKALAEGDHKAAVRYYERAVELDPDNGALRAQLDAAMAGKNAALAQRAPVDTVSGNTSLLRDAARVEYEEAMKAAQARLAEREFAAAIDLAEKAKTVVDRNQRQMTDATARDLRSQADALSVEITEAEVRDKASTELRSGQAEQAASAARDRQQRDVQALLQQARTLQHDMEYDRALELLDQALFIDPTNLAAQAMKDMVEDSKVVFDYRDAKRESSLEEARLAVSNAETAVPYDDLLVYPHDWPQVTTARLSSLEEESDAQANSRASQLLREPVPINFDGNRLEAVVEYLRNTSGANFFVNWPALEAVGIERDAPVSLQLANVSADQALRLVLQQVGQVGEFDPIGYTITEGVVTIDTLKNLNIEPDVKAEPAPEPEKPEVRKPRLMPVNPWVMAVEDALSTFALDVDTASFGIARRYIHDGFLPPRHTVRMEEFVNAFDYQYPTGKQDSDAFAVHAEAGAAPFGKDVVLVKVGVRGKVVGRDQAKPAHLVFVIDTSGSMEREDRLPLVKQGLAMLLDQLAEQDRVSVVSYGTEARLLVENASVSSKTQIMMVLDDLQTGGSTNVLAGVAVGYEMARRHIVPGGVNRIILCSDGVANVGPSEAEDLVKQVAHFRGQGVTFTSVGVGSGNYDDQLLEQLSNKGDGSYLFLGSIDDARTAFVEDLAATRPTIAYDAKIQVEFNPQRVRRYRLIGYENRDIADSDFRNDAVDAGEVGSGQSATALYEVELLGPATGVGASELPDLGTVYVRYRDAETGEVKEHATRLSTRLIAERTPGSDPRFYLAACAAEFAEVLRGSEHVESQDLNRNLDAIQRVLTDAVAQLPLDAKAHDLLDLVRRAHGLPRAE